MSAAKRLPRLSAAPNAAPLDARIYVLSLGCAKNSVDSASMAELLVRSGCRLVETPEDADVIVVNTCGFIEPARQESLDALRQLAGAKAPGQLLVAAGCLAQLWGADLSCHVPGIDGLLGTRRWMDVVGVIGPLREGVVPPPMLQLSDAAVIGPDPAGIRRAHVAGASAFLKIADGCNRPCTFCTIPAIKGPWVSRPVEAIMADARQLRDSGVLEINLVAQDTTSYGMDLGIRDGLAQLIERLVVEVPDVPWIRILYAYPGSVSERLMAAIATHRQIVPYLDLPLQHAHPDMLRRMGRPRNVLSVRRTFTALRQAIPDLALRTTFIVGFPGETEAEFETLLQFLDDVRFDCVGAFEYSFEPGSRAEALGDPVPPMVKRTRWERLMERQRKISLETNRSWVGRQLDVLIEGAAGGLSVGRSFRDAPEVDGLVLVSGQHPVGRMLEARVTAAMVYDLTAEAI